MNVRMSLCIACIAIICCIIWIPSRQRAVDIDYLYGVARYDSPFGITGTEPEALREAVKNLAHTRTLLALSQSSVDDMYYVYRSLYPLRFMYALADLEEARLDFLSMQTATSARAYLRHMSRVVAQGENDALRHLNARLSLARTTPTHNRQIYSFSGLSSEATIISDTKEILNTMHDMRMKIEEIVSCATKGTCSPPSRKPYIAEHEMQKYSPPSPMQGKIEDFLRKEVPDSTFDRVSLYESRCLQVLEKPYHMLVRTTSQGIPHTHTINKLFFYDVGRSTGNTIEYLSTHDVTYAAYRAMNFYICPGSQHDRGMVFALLHARKILGEDAPLESDGALYEPRVRGAVEKYYTTQSNTEDMRDIEELMRMFEERNAKLDILVDNIAHSLRIRTEQEGAGVPVDISAHTLFLTMSAYSSLFLTHASDETSARISPPAPSRADIMSEFEKSFIAFPRLIEKVEMEELLDDVRTVRTFDAGDL